jgi:hypothetical protein
MAGLCYAPHSQKYGKKGIKIGPGKRVLWGTIGSSVLFSSFFAFFFGGAIWGGSPVLGAGTHYM